MLADTLIALLLELQVVISLARQVDYWVVPRELVEWWTVGQLATGWRPVDEFSPLSLSR